MAPRLTEKQKMKIVADYLETQSINSAAKKNGVSWASVKKVLEESGEIEKKLEQKKEQNTADILAYMDTKKDVVCAIIGDYLEALRDKEKIEKATTVQLSTTLGTLIDKFTMVSKEVGQNNELDPLSKSLEDMGKELTGD